LRSTLRALARERHRENIGPQAPFVLVGRTDGRLTLLDPSTGQRIDLEAFGPSNAAVFASLRLAGPATASR
jgi:putative photosynthetic complex assembly protein